jgi:hypothetical protein
LSDRAKSFSQHLETPRRLAEGAYRLFDSRPALRIHNVPGIPRDCRIENDARQEAETAWKRPSDLAARRQRKVGGVVDV